MNSVGANTGSAHGNAAGGSPARGPAGQSSPASPAPDQLLLPWNGEQHTQADAGQTAAASSRGAPAAPAGRPRLWKTLGRRLRWWDDQALEPPNVVPNDPSDSQVKMPRPGTDRTGQDKQADDEEPPRWSIPANLHRRYIVDKDSKFYFRDRQQALAFEDLGSRIRTKHDDADVAVSMVELAEAKGWRHVRLRGSAEFKRHAWMAASERGLTISGYRPSPLDKSQLAERLADQQHPPSEPVPADPAKPRKNSMARNAKSAAKQPTTDAPQDQAGKLSPRQQRTVEALRQFLRNRGDSDAAVDMTAALATAEMGRRRAHFGQLLEHGPARYQHQPGEDPSYFATLATPTGPQTVWGVDLKRAIEDSGTTIGDNIVLVQRGRVPVSVSARERDANGKPTGPRQRIDANRNLWDVFSLDNTREFASQPQTQSPPAPGRAQQQSQQPRPAAPPTPRSHSDHREPRPQR